jgi:hypothetical protein
MIRKLLLALTLAAAAPALANPAATKAADITGAWAFTTQTYGDACKLSGTVVVKPAGKNFTCTMTAQEICRDIKVRAKETCTATRNGDNLVIKANVISVTPDVGYVPDDFELKIQGSAYMKGMLRSFHSAPVEFFRGDAPVS